MLTIDYTVTSTLSVEEEIKQQIAIENDNYSISENEQNWIFDDRQIRIIINNSESMKAFISDVNYRALMNAIVEKHEDFILVNSTNSIVYVNTLDDTEIAIVQHYIYSEENKYGLIYLENKI